MIDPIALPDFEDYLVSQAGGYLRNPIREQRATCAVCTTPVTGYRYCATCNGHVATHRDQLADAVAPLTYAVANTQAGYVMRGYKARRPIDEHRAVVLILAWLGVTLHAGCAGQAVGLPVTHWATVPSLPPKPGEHPFHRIIAASPPNATEVTLTAAPSANAPRDAAASQFTTPAQFTSRAHILVLDDTWATGGHAQSAALALRQAGAERVSIMVAARWIKREFGDNDTFIRQRLTNDYNPRICPWTGDRCP